MTEAARVWFVHIGEPYPKGTGSRLSRYGLILPALADQGFAVTWWTSTFDHLHRTAHSSTREEFDHRGVTVVGVPGIPYRSSVGIRRIAHHVVTARRFIRLMRSRPDRPDLIVSALPTPENVLLTRRLARAWDIPFVVDVRDNWPLEIFAQVPGGVRPLVEAVATPYVRALGRSLDEATTLVASSQAQLDYGAALARRPPGRGDRIIYHPYSPDHPGPRQHLNDDPPRGDDPRLRVCFAGTLGRYFDFDPILSAADELRGEGITFTIAGTGENADRLRDVVAEKGLDDHVDMPGWLDHRRLVEVYRSSHVALAPYRGTSGMGNKFAEYLAHGLPVLTTLDGEVSALLDRYGCGHLYGSGDGHSLARALRTFRSSPDLLAAARQGARACFEDNFTVTTSAAKFGEVITGALLAAGQDASISR